MVIDGERNQLCFLGHYALFQIPCEKLDELVLSTHLPRQQDFSKRVKDNGSIHVITEVPQELLHKVIALLCM